MDREKTITLLRTAAAVARRRGVVHGHWTNSAATLSGDPAWERGTAEPPGEAAIGCAVGTLGIAFAELFPDRVYSDRDKEVIHACLAAARDLAEHDGFPGTLITCAADIEDWVGSQMIRDTLWPEWPSNPLSLWFEGGHGGGKARPATREELIDLFLRTADRLEAEMSNTHVDQSAAVVP